MKLNKHTFILLPLILLTSCGKVPTNVYLNLSSTEDNQAIHTVKQQEYLDALTPDSYISQNKYDLGTFSNSAPIPTRFSWTIEMDVAAKCSYELEISKNENFNDSYIVETKVCEADVYNLEINQEYFYKVTAKFKSVSFVSDVKEIYIEDEAPRNVFVEGVENIRDLGGWPLEDGKTYKQGLIYRSSEFNGDEDGLSKPTKEGITTLKEQLKIKTEIDLRKTIASFDNDEVCGITSSPLGEDVNYVSCPMHFGGSNIFRNADNKESIKKFFDTLADESNYPIAFHCVRGTDRTGALAYAIGALCGVSEDDLMTDYLFSNFANIGSSAIRESNISGSSFYVMGIANSSGETLSEKAKNYLNTNCDIPFETLDKIIGILTEDESK